ncbi:MAG: zinc-ribbon domain-containing protein, partial [Pseudomonadota bacterium]|nr:zinc-ribbon domain-containing protein [Pseudomonadota bacterium]
MFTQCDRCATVFRLAPAALRAAGGQVRCGRCGELFDALARLAEDGSSFAHRESSPDLESRADEILRATGDGAEPAPPSTAPTAPLLAEEPALSASFEFSLPPGELDRIFIETSPGILNVLTADRGPVGSGPTEAVDTAAFAPVEPEAQPGHPPVTQHPSAVAAPGVPTVVADTPPHLAETAVSDMPNIAPPRKRMPMSVWSAAALL